jgi:DNA modification methylase
VVQLRSNIGETVFTPFMGVGSECYVPVLLGRRAIGVELKNSYFKQAVKNMEGAETGYRYDQVINDLFDVDLTVSGLENGD